MVIIVFDFDDTIFATSHFLGKDPVVCLELVDSINEILEIASRYGKVFIITNAQKEWLKLCVEKYLPGCVQLEKYLGEDGRVFSSIDNGLAKDKDVASWKTLAFQEKLKQHFEDGSCHHLICFGDNLFDRAAALNIKEMYKNVVVKNILMVAKPSLDALIWQHKVITDCFHFLSTYHGHLDLCIKVFISQTISSLSTIQKSSGEIDPNFDLDLGAENTVSSSLESVDVS
jgi:hypothetical protein